MTLGAPSGRHGRRPDRIATLTVAILLLMGVAAPSANATLRVINHNDPAGDPTSIMYRLSTPDRNPLIPDFPLPDEQCVLPQDAEHCGASFGVDPTRYGTTYTIQMVTQGWRTEDIQCIGVGAPGEFTKDLANNKVTVQHNNSTYEQTCAFTNVKISGSGSGSGSSQGSTGLSPSIPASEVSKVSLPRGAALVGVRVGRGWAAASVRITRHSVIKAQLLDGKTVVGTARVVRNAGTRTVRVTLKQKAWRSLRARGLKRRTFTLRVTVVAGKTTKVFRHRVLVRL
ncbi:MAG TPA: hypothetical protein VH834_16590 [Solirubrobacteraceae bacterium]|jgi:hypothetical protein